MRGDLRRRRVAPGGIVVMRIHIGVLHATGNFSKLADDIKKQISGLVHETTEEVAAEYKQAVTTGVKTGRDYGEHKASAPGESPADLTHELVNSVSTNYPAEDRGEMKVGAGHGHTLEFGSKRIAARPTIRPIMEQKGPEFKRKCAKIIRDAAKAAEVK